MWSREEFYTAETQRGKAATKGKELTRKFSHEQTERTEKKNETARGERKRILTPETQRSQRKGGKHIFAENEEFRNIALQNRKITNSEKSCPGLNLVTFAIFC